MNWLALGLLAIGGVVLTIGDLFMKKWVVSNFFWIYIIGMFFYIIGLNFLAFSFKYKNIAVASVIFILINIITLLLFSYFYFKEKLGIYEIAGITLGIIAIIMLELAEK
jgi:multidrug transporter EmrE-like cation transporter